MYRISIFSELEMTTSYHIGGGVESFASDAPVLRDSRGLPFISGGALASAFSKSCSDALLSREWLGIPLNSNTDDGKVSRVIFNDALPLHKQRQSLSVVTEVRRRNSVNRETNSCQDDMLFDVEVIPAGAVMLFSCRFDAKNQEEGKQFKEYIGRYLSGGGSLGGKSRIGLGKWQASKWACYEYDLCTREGLKDWFLNGRNCNWHGSTEILQKINNNLSPITVDKPTKDNYWTIDCVVVIDGLHMSSGSTGLPIHGEPDQVQATRKKIDTSGTLSDEYIDYGSTILGRLRSTMEFLLRTHLKSRGVANEQVLKAVPVDNSKSSIDDLADFFGYISKEIQSFGKCGEWCVGESKWEDPNTREESHIRVDQYQQHPMDGALFTYEPLIAGTSTIRISLPTNDCQWKRDLIRHAVTFMAMEVIPIAGKGSRGYLGAKIVSVSDNDSGNLLLNATCRKSLKEIVADWARNPCTTSVGRETYV